ncbi:MAG: sulfotransferase family protein, partial [Actinomycetota bacterium]|nr:sulfotransferase family protein [Actinomycetota bacterium]
MKVLGVGFGRSGTMSLKAALEELGAAPCLHMIDLIRNNELIPPWHDAAIKGDVDFDRMFAGFEATIDW